ncbi:hypothetical protein GLOTRDRAFT_132607 [Gloeophyllum trabeum ATCC 11539]|uniref:Uncharacterized protein n=1 Tax=Gloeophyllum trabeum (strain ATCC 11539 / FP-39264 / Madison 617) TaxID=670483 RepID=S7RC29_GLOTA|nr:uncharacterized protein GLOTRDRAFT_132607 [Gloeophyllum trabeum ATCC 11539]EPQ51795.1 hypothetical protein GLOTRDRAFT_132607 [Gloeophyllum trabeum ATCC 11539]
MLSIILAVVPLLVSLLGHSLAAPHAACSASGCAQTVTVRDVTYNLAGSHVNGTYVDCEYIATPHEVVIEFACLYDNGYIVFNPDVCPKELAAQQCN